MTAVGETSADERPEMLGAYFRIGRSQPFTGVPASELTDRIISLDDLWAGKATELAAELGDTKEESTRINRLESALVARLGRAAESSAPLKLNSIADCLLQSRGRLRVERLAEAAGVSRQHLARTFRNSIGVTPKRLGRLARFHAGLVYGGSGRKIDWAQVALELGYADQSHMIAEFRTFSSLTPEMLARQQWFHPFIERARHPIALIS